MQDRRDQCTSSTFPSSTVTVIPTLSAYLILILVR